MDISRIFCLVLVAGACLAQPRDTELNQLADRVFDQLIFHYDPASGTQAGFHQYDALMPTLSRAEIDANAAATRKFIAEVEAFDPRGLSPWGTSDRELMLSQLRSQLLALENIRMWEKNPDNYTSYATGAIFVIMSRTFAPPAERLKSAIAREKAIPRLFQSARENLRNPPEIYTSVALEQLPGIESFFEKDVPAAFNQVKDPALLAQFQQSNQATIAALKSYEAFLKNDLLPRSKGDFRIGADNYRKKLLYDEMVDTPLDRLLAIGYDDLHRNQAELKRVAAKIDPKRSPEDILQDLENDHPTAANLLNSFRDVLGGLRQYIEAHRIVSIPSQVMPTVEETPPFMRALTSASMDSPGAYEKVAKQAFFNVTLPDPTWPAKEVDEYLQGFNRGTIVSTAIHEAFPGHYVQFLFVPSVPTKIRKLMGAGSNIEGWAHYTEQMMLDQGYGNGDLKLRLGQLQDALLRDARYIVGIEMHTENMTVDQAVDFFIKEGHQVRPTAEKEAKRGTSDPTYLVYTLGKLEIMKLRDDYKKMKGDRYTLEGFHNAFLQQGTPPVKLVRKALLGNDTPVL
ncbi:MAG TPA: DUF885 domain-containing protein [Bryobacteraceae bacterium]|jgi:uncharacterized protein (DUF885 family)|nr:DUF885 domain-containing protein [Bryobacteraceae bacterium]